MNENDFGRTARTWLDDGPTRMSDRAVLSTLEEIHTTRQRRALWPAWSATPVSSFLRVAGAAVLVITVGLLAINVVPRQPDGSSVGGQSPSPSPAQAVDFPAMTTTFVSPRNGFAIQHPDQASVTPATHGFPGPEDDDGFDVVETGLATVFRGTSMDIDAGDSFGGMDLGGGSDVVHEGIYDVIDDRDDCGAPRSQHTEITIDGQSGRIWEDCPNQIEATVVTRGRLYFFTLSHERSDARAVFDAFAATIDLTPETAVDVPPLTDNFVSPTYGYSFGYIDRGGLTPATELWDPGNQPLKIDFDDRLFDAVNTGLAAYLLGASTPIPGGASIDDRVDEYVTPLAAGGCGVPRRQQAEITIDGQSGRIAECPGRVEATVVLDGRLYLFALGHQRRDARAFFNTWIATIDLTPETATVP